MNIAAAKRIPLDQLLAMLGYHPHRRQGDDLWYLSPIRDETTASFKINRTRNVWYDHGVGTGGDVIDFMRVKFRLPSVADALKQLDDLDGNAPLPAIIRTSAVSANNDQPPAMVIDDVHPVRSRALMGYINSRGISEATTQTYLNEVSYRSHGRSYFAIGFNTDAGGYELRSPTFKGAFGKKDMTTIPGDSNKVFVFEGFFDF